ncbi:uncharacterized protein [Nicotiana sylvestris]|uniref:uncharacterized protein n=1 Tax=Nicotiana sylvestris TaxID=4096 RepID=UPI00388C953F
MTLVNTVYDGKGYPGWKISILLSLSAKKKLGFINGACKAPDLNFTDYVQWSCVNDMVTSWILNALSKDIVDSVIYSKPAKELWDSLEQRFGKSNGAKLVHLQKEQSSLTQRNSDIDENQREIYANAHFSLDSASFMVAGQGKQSNAQVFADFAAFILIGFPDDFKFTNPKTYQNHVKANVVATHEEDNGTGQSNEANSSSFEHHFNKEQIAEMMDMYKQAKSTQSGGSGINANDVGLSMRIPQVFGEVREGLYLLEPSNFKSSSMLSSNVISFSKGRNSSSRLGHVPISAMKHLHFFHCASNYDFICDICPKAKQTRNPFPISNIKTKHVFDLIHIDTWGPYKSSTYNGFKCFLTIVDDYSRGTWTFLLSAKSNAFPMLKSFLYLVERQFNVKVKMIRSDNALELGKGTLEADFLASEGILHQLSCVGTP